MSSILASCSVEESKNYVGSLYIPHESVSKKTGKVIKKKQRVLLNIDFTADEACSIDEFLTEYEGAAACVTLEEGVNYPSLFPETSLYVFIRVSLSRLDEAIASTSDDKVRFLVTLPDGKPDLRRLVSYCKVDKRVRFTGGDLLNIPGLNIGRFDDGDIKGIAGGVKAVANGSYDSFDEVSISQLEGIEQMLKASKRRSKATKKKSSERLIDLTDTKKPSKPRVKKPSRSASMKSLFTPSNTF